MTCCQAPCSSFPIILGTLWGKVKNVSPEHIGLNENTEKYKISNAPFSSSAQFDFYNTNENKINRNDQRHSASAMGNTPLSCIMRKNDSSSILDFLLGFTTGTFPSKA